MRRSLPVLSNPDPSTRGEGSADAAALARALAEVIRGEVRFRRHDRMLYATDASIYQVEPVGVVVPRDAADVEATMRVCREHGAPLLPRGGGTSLAGQTVNAAVVLDFSAWCTQLLDVDVDGRRARVQPGLVLDHLNRAVATHGLAFGPDVATSTHATIGGMIGNNSAGAHSILYGRTVEHVRGLDVVLADGQRVRCAEGASTRDSRVAELTRQVAEIVTGLETEIRARFPRTRRRVNGYNLDLMLDQIQASTPGTYDAVNLAHLFCGSEGTLGVTVEAELDLVPAPRRKALGIVAFDGVDEALEAVIGLIETRPAAVELVDDVIIGLARANIEYRRYVDLMPRPDGRDPGAVLYVEYYADDDATIDDHLAALEQRFGSGRVRRVADPVGMGQAWKLRKAGEPLLHGQPGARKPVTFIEDTAVEPARLREFIRRFRAIVDAHGTTASYYAHASVGCLHVRPMICLTDASDVQSMQRIMVEVTDLVMEFGGALSGEHGDGRLRSHLLPRFYGDAICAGLGAIKRVFDPEGRLNPGNIIDGVSMVERLRVRPDDSPVPVPATETYFRYEHEHGFAGAVEMCNGAGVCRKTSGGTMCPSYRATRDERHATRGRGNALRLAITGQLGEAGRPLWNDPETLETLDLCLSCKACKSECPSNVDMARLKAEYLAQGYAAGAPVPLAVRAASRLRALNRTASWAPRLASALAGSAPSRWFAARFMGIDPRRSMPEFGASLRRWWVRSRGAGSVVPAGMVVPDPDAPAVILYPDCFAGYGESAIGRAAASCLTALGYRVVIPDVGCCGRPAISNGRLDVAQRECRRTAMSLLDAVEAHDAVAILVSEPSCASAMTDDWLDLEIGVDRVALDRLATKTQLLSDFVEGRWEDHPRRPALTAATTPILVHGHCHQKALWNMEPTLALLRRVTTGDVQLIDAGCCGMAGSFGYTRAHFDLSMRIGEETLFPTVRKHPDATLVATGTSCRHQLRDATHRTALHPIQLIAEALQKQ